MLNTWDAAIIRRYNQFRSSSSTERTGYTVTLASDSLEYLDRTLNELRRRSPYRGIEAVAEGAELTALRSAAVEVAASSYADGVRHRRPLGHSGGDRRRDRGLDLRNRVAARRSQRLRSIVCLLSPDLVADLDDVLSDALGMQADTLDRGTARQVGLEEARSVVIEAAVVAWLILRGYSAAVPARRPFGSWLAAVLHLTRSRGRRNDG